MSQHEFEDWTWKQIELNKSSVALRSPTPHSSLYKYVGLQNKTSWNYFEKMLDEFKLYGSTINSLNDPFEGAPFLIDDLTPEIVKSLVFSRFEYNWKKSQGEQLPDFDYLQPFREEARSYFEKVLSEYRILAFCERGDSPLLWSHYGNSYAGACIHFLGRAFSGQRPRAPKLGYVSYSSQRPSLPLSLALAFAKNSAHRSKDSYLNRAELEKFCFFSKGLDWQYENEIRAIFNIKNDYHLEFNPNGLVGITIGPRMSLNDKEKLISIVKNSKLSNLTVNEARLAKNTFAVNTVEKNLNA